jgi:tetratricopeptide (TPR) repeat protein
MQNRIPILPIVFRDAVVSTMLVTMLCGTIGCQSASRGGRYSSSFRRSDLDYSQTESVHGKTPPVHDLEFHSPESGSSEFQPSEIPSIPPMQEPALTEEEIVSIYRNAGGKLRPNQDGNIVEIDLSFSQITDKNLLSVDVFPHLTEMDLTGSQIHDESIVALQKLNNLRAVKLKGTRITDEGMKLLSQMPTLILLDASNTEITDDGLTEVGQLSELRYLSLNNTAVSDEGLRHLGSLRNMKGLSVINTAVTEDGVRQLKQLLPECLIVAQPGKADADEQTDSADSVPRLPEIDPLNTSQIGTSSQSQLSQVTALAAQHPHLALHLSRIYSSREQWKEAAQILGVAAAANPSDRSIQFALGQALARSGRPEEALHHFKLAVDDATAKYQVALIVYENSLKRCEQLFDDALEANPSLTAAESRRSGIQQELAQIRSRRGRSIPRENPHEELEVVPAPPVRAASHTRVKRGP